MFHCLALCEMDGGINLSCGCYQPGRWTTHCVINSTPGPAQTEPWFHCLLLSCLSQCLLSVCLSMFWASTFQLGRSIFIWLGDNTRIFPLTHIYILYLTCPKLSDYLCACVDFCMFPMHICAWVRIPHCRHGLHVKMTPCWGPVLANLRIAFTILPDFN